MKTTYTGGYEGLSQVQKKKLDARFAKLGKLVDRNSEEKEARVILTSERHLQNAEITLNYYDHALVGVGSGPDQFAAISTALDKLEKQVHKVSEKWRTTKRSAPKGKAAKLTPKGAAWEEAEAPPAPPETAAPQIFRVNHRANRKPMTIDEAVLAMEDRDYVVYRDAETDRIAVLLRRRDGNFDLVQA
ncbi:MAG: HPF/RaiA family ribosome-associated protein [Bryobacteraceae bacterium]